ncbi:MAG: hypothetical protein BRD55_04445 [Bacteroidetes bacterium SW_9_63_38]|nr:MAG: hypothetical protein BRD55_04445 [Bacteroidetes bacterium SW_9_63_38]
MERDDVFQDDVSGRSPLALDQGTLLNDQFRVGRVLGVGGFGITYLAVDEVLEMVVAVKEFLPNDIAVRKSDGNTVQPLSSETGAVGGQDFEFGLERFLQEARTLAKFEAHENIVRVRTFFEEKGTGYLVMNFYEGRTLAQYLEARNGFLPEEETLLIMEQVADGLSAVHEEGILHRDIDPNNVYLADNGTVVLLDFGAARSAVGERTQSMSVVLKRGYAPHEQYHSHGDQGPWTDVYACAATLYRTLTGYKPPEAAARILDDDLASPDELVPSLSGATNDAVLQGLAIRPDDRPRSMEAFSALLPDPSPDADPGWVGEISTTEVAAEPDDASAELQVTATHPCRLYVDGSRTAELAPGEAYTLGVASGSHRIRAVRTDQAGTGTATVTDAGTEGQVDGETRMSLDNLVWQTVVSVAINEPKDLDIDFSEEASGSLADEHRGMEGETMRADAAATEAPAEPEEAPDTADASAGSEEDAEEGAREDAPTESPAPASASEAADNGEDESVDPSAAAPPERGAPSEADRDPAETVREAAEWARAAAQTAVRTGRERVGTGAEVAVETMRESPRRVAAAGAGLIVLLILLGIGWWATSNRAPTAVPDRVVTMSDSVTVDVLANDRDPDGQSLRVVRAGGPPDSVAQVTVIDSEKLRIQPTDAFVGTATVDYTVTDGTEATASAAVTLGVPFNGQRQVVSQSLEQPQVVRADSLGDDSSLDVLAAALGRPSVAWSENARSDTSGFQAPKPIGTAIDGAVDLHSADLTGNGRVDVLAISLRDDMVAWYKNEGRGTFGERKTLSADLDGASTVGTADVDGDGDADVVVGAVLAQTVVWFENKGGGEFRDGVPIATDVQGLETIHIADLDRDDVPDVLAVAYQDNIINRYEPADSSSDSLRFVERPAVGTDLQEPIEVHAANLSQDAPPDLLAGTVGAESLFLFENRTDRDTLEAFGDKQMLAREARTIEDIEAGDLDDDGDQDVLAAAFDSGTVVWVENKGERTFAPPRTIAMGVPNVISIDVTDVDGDGDLDVLTASQADNTIGWHENRLVDDTP